MILYKEYHLSKDILSYLIKSHNSAFLTPIFSYFYFLVMNASSFLCYLQQKYTLHIPIMWGLERVSAPNPYHYLKDEIKRLILINSQL